MAKYVIGVKNICFYPMYIAESLLPFAAAHKTGKGEKVKCYQAYEVIEFDERNFTEGFISYEPDFEWFSNDPLITDEEEG